MPPPLFPLSNLLSASLLKQGCWNSSWLGGWSPGEQRQLECNLCCWGGSWGQLIPVLGWKVQGRDISALLNHPLMHGVKQETLPVTHWLGWGMLCGVISFSCLALLFSLKSNNSSTQWDAYYIQLCSPPERGGAEVLQVTDSDKRKIWSEHMPLHAWDKIGQWMTSSVSLLTHLQESRVPWWFNLETTSFCMC